MSMKWELSLYTGIVLMVWNYQSLSMLLFHFSSRFLCCCLSFCVYVCVCVLMLFEINWTGYKERTWHKGKCNSLHYISLIYIHIPTRIIQCWINYPFRVPSRLWSLLLQLHNGGCLMLITLLIKENETSRGHWSIKIDVQLVG